MFPYQNFNSADQFPTASNHVSKYVSSLQLLALCSTDNGNRVACKAEGLKHNVVPLTCTCFSFFIQLKQEHGKTQQKNGQQKTGMKM